LNLGY
jgi:hypothetical protein